MNNTVEPGVMRFILPPLYAVTMLLCIAGNLAALLIFTCRPSRLVGEQRAPPPHPHPSLKHQQPLQSAAKQTQTLKSSPSSTHCYDQVEQQVQPTGDNEADDEIHPQKSVIIKQPSIVYHSRTNTTGSVQTRRSSFSYYLASLAVSDLLMGLVCIPITFTQNYLHYWPFPPQMCSLVTYLQLVAVTVSSFTNTAIALNRLVGILNPFRRRPRLGDRSPTGKIAGLADLVKLACSFWRKTIGIMVSIWLVALGTSIVQFYVTTTNPVVEGNSSIVPGRVICEEDWKGETTNRRIYTIVLFITIYVIPLTIQGVTYSFIGIKLWRHSTPGEQIKQHETVRLKEKRRVIKMLVCIVALFGLCWLPLYVYFFIDDFTTFLESMSRQAQSILYCVCHWTAMANSFVNPIIYFMMSKSFKVGWM